MYTHLLHKLMYNLIHITLRIRVYCFGAAVITDQTALTTQNASKASVLHGCRFWRFRACNVPLRVQSTGLERIDPEGAKYPILKCLDSDTKLICYVHASYVLGPLGRRRGVLGFSMSSLTSCGVHNYVYSSPLAYSE